MEQYQLYISPLVGTNLAQLIDQDGLLSVKALYLGKELVFP